MLSSASCNTHYGTSFAARGTPAQGDTLVTDDWEF